MKQFIILFAILLSLKALSQKEGDAILGKWIDIPRQNTIIEVSEINDEYKGKIVWTKTANKKKPIGFMILEGLKYDTQKKTWEKGKVHVPNSGIVYNASARIKEDGILEVNGYLGLKFLGKRKNFKKVK
jgi:uncharacterized protein (DUF2147 family)